MRVGLVELAFHNEVLRSYINILKDLTDEITCFTNRFCFDQVYDYQDDPRVSWEIKEVISNKKYFENKANELKACDVVIIITLDEDLEYFATYTWPTKTILLVHDYFSFFEPNQINYSGTIEEKARATKSYLQYKTKSEKKKIESLVAKMDKLAVPSLSIMNFVKSRNPISKLTEVLDFAIPNDNPKKAKEEKTVIVIPGNVIPKSRNYMAVVNALKKVGPKLSDTELVILGQAKTSYGRGIIHELDKFQDNNFKVKYYNSFINQVEFDKQLWRSDFLLLPISKVMRYRHFKEMNGFTCVSGNINDMLYFGKPAIIPKFYPLGSVAENVVERYNNENHLAEILIEWINNEKHLIYSKEMKETQLMLRKQVSSRFKKAIS